MSFPFVKEFCATHVIWIKIIMFGVFVVNKKKKKPSIGILIHVTEIYFIIILLCAFICIITFSQIIIMITIVDRQP